MRPVPRPRGMDLVANLLLGALDDPPSLPPAEAGGVHAAFERAIIPALERPPCVVSFSGGRDSSAVLALAVQIARRHGLPEPVPTTLRFPRVAESEESAWQALVLSHLKLKDQELIELGEELDALGPAATAQLRRDGVRWPANAYVHAPIVERARGGSLLTGVGGDELLATRGARHVLLLRGRVRPRPRDALALAVPLAPRRLRAAVWLRRKAQPTPWLTPAGADALNRTLAREESAWPHRWDRSLHYWYRSRGYAGLDGALFGMAREQDVTVVNPFLNPSVLAALAVAGGPTGFPDRATAMTRLFRDLLPHRLITRGTKAAFTGAFWGPATREFAHSWSGEGLAGAQVDRDALRREWLSAQPHFQTALLLHSAWLHDHGGPAQPSPASS